MDTRSHRPQALRFTLKSIGFVLLGLMLMNLVGWLIISTRLHYLVVGSEVYDAQSRVARGTSARLVVIGDSVGRQLLSAKNEHRTGHFHLTTNQAISMAGQYLLVKKLLARAPNLRVVYLLTVPHSLRNDLDQIYTFNYFCKPFYTLENREHLSRRVIEQLSRHPYYPVCLLPMVKASRMLSDTDFSRPGADPHKAYLSGISIDYLQRLQRELSAAGVRFRVLSPPIPRSKAVDFTLLKKQIAAAKLGEAFEDYFEHLEVIEDELFRDGVHLKREEVARYQDRFIRLLDVPGARSSARPGTAR